MTPEIFGRQFHLLADAPNGIKRIRELVLQLAVQGRLVPQEPNDEPASELLKKIKAEKAKLAKEGKIKGPKPLPELEPDEVPYELPDGWEWTRLATVSKNIHFGYNASANLSIRNVRLLRITDIQNDQVNWDSVPGCEISDDKAKNYVLSDGDILIARTGGTIGKSYLVNNLTTKAVFASYLIRVLPVTNSYPPYLKVFFGSQLYWSQLYEKSMGTGQPNVNGTALKSLGLPLPPLTEQKRIVAKVNQLMALCDELEAKQQKRAESRVALNKSCLHFLTSPESEPIGKAWKRIHDNFDLLYECPENVAVLRQSVLQLAVMGKLVPQDPNDESATELIKKINAEKTKRVKDGTIKKQKPLPSIDLSNIPYELSKGWKWERLGEISLEITDGTHHTPNYVEKGVPFISIKDISSGKLDFSNTRFISQNEHDELKRRCYPQKDDILFTRIGTLGVNVLVDTDREFSLFVSVGLIKFFTSLIYPQYLEKVLNSPVLKKQYDDVKAGGSHTNKLNLKSMPTLLIPIAPYAEQKRIVAKIDQLMALCDELESKLDQSQAKAESLLEAVVRELTAA